MSERMVQHKSSTLTWRSEMNKSKSQRQPQLATGVLSTSGEEGIRTLGEVSPTQHFQCCTIDHSATSPAPCILLARGV